jgi:hypothetical protein
MPFLKFLLLLPLYIICPKLALEELEDDQR